MSYTQKKSQTKPVIMFSTFAGTYDFTHRKHGRESVPAIADSCKKEIGGIDKSNQSLYGYLDGKRSLQWSKKVIFDLLMRLIMNSYILYKLNMEKH